MGSSNEKIALSFNYKTNVSSTILQNVITHSGRISGQWQIVFLYAKGFIEARYTTGHRI